MSELDLDQEARDVIAAGRDGAEPTSLQRARVRRRVQAELVAGAAALATTSSSIVAIAKIGTIAALVGGVAGGSWIALRHRPSATAALAAPAPVAASARPVARPAEPAMDAPTAVAPSAAPTPVPMPSPAATRETAAREGLAAEVELLARANGAVSRGDPNGALELLRQYDRRFPAGRLQAERAAAGVLALCGAGRTREASAAADRFQKRWPRSPLAPRVASACVRGSK